MKGYWYHIIALITAIIWGTTFVSTKILIQKGLTPTEIFLYRFLLAYVILLPFTIKKIFSNNIKDEFLFLLLGFSGGSLYFITENTALQITLASNVALIVCTAPILTAFFYFLFNKDEKITGNLIRGFILAFLGVALVVFNGSIILQINLLGDFLTILASISWAFYGILLKKIESRYSIFFIIQKVFFYGIITLLPMFYFQPLNYNKEIIFQPTVFINLLFLGIVASLLCFVMWNIAVKKIGVIQTTNYIYIVPLVTMITSSIILDEKITLIGVLGSVAILIGVYIAGRGLDSRAE